MPLLAYQPNLAGRDFDPLSGLNGLLVSFARKRKKPNLADFSFGLSKRHSPFGAFACFISITLLTNSFNAPLAYALRDFRPSMINVQRNWYVVYSKPHKEAQVQLHLGLKGIESFFPRLQLPGSVNKNKGIAPLFPNYLFVRVNLATESHYVIWSPGVKRIVSFSDTPIPIEDSVVQFLREKANTQGIIQAQSQLRPGQQVEITGGPFDGFTGIIENPPNAKGRVKILLKLLSRQISVRLGVEFVRQQSVAIVPAMTIHDRPDLLSAAS